MYFLPYMLFSFHTSKSWHTALSSSASNGNVKRYLAMNLSCDATLSGETPTPAPGIGRLWARGRVDELEDRLRRGADVTEVRPMIVVVALRHGLVTRFTSLVAVDRTPARPEGETMGSTRIANATPAGSLAFAQGSTGWPRELALAAALALLALALMRSRS